MECERSSSAETEISSQDAGNHRRRSSSVAGRRMYECTFCKRGFTNAQALGGHMNIHRRDRAKAKQNTNANANANATTDEESFDQFHYINPNTSSSTVGVKSTTDHQSSCHVQLCFPSSLSGSKLIGGCEQDVLRASLSLGIGSTTDIDENFIERRKESVVEGDEIDLELRLGS